MKLKAGISALVVVALTLTSLSALAQGRGKGGGQADRQSQVDRDRSYDRDRQKSRDRSEAQDRDRDQQRAQDFSKLRDADMYGSKLMSPEERNQYRGQLQNAKTAQERTEIRAQHHEKMQTRANAQGVDLVPPGQGPVYGGNLMSVQERIEYRSQLQFAASDEERNRMVARHREEMQSRAKQRGIELEDVEEAE